MTLILKVDLGMIKVHYQTKNEVSMLRHSKVWPKQTHADTHTHMLQGITDEGKYGCTDNCKEYLHCERF